MKNQLPEMIDEQLPRLTVKEIQNETFKFFNLEKGLLFTFLALMKDPHTTIDTYLNFDRRKFTNPLQYILIGVAVYTLIFSVHPSFTMTMKDMNELNAKNYAKIEKDLNIKIAQPFAEAQQIYLAYQNVFYLILIPVVSFATFFLFEKGFNYAENLAINAFVFGTTTWFSTVLSIATFFIEHFSIIIIVIPLISIMLTISLYKRIFQEGWFKTFGISMIVFGLLLAMSVVIQFGIALILIFT